MERRQSVVVVLHLVSNVQVDVENVPYAFYQRQCVIEVSGQYLDK
jgi:hypothetical protein